MIVDWRFFNHQSSIQMIWYYANEGKRVGPIETPEFQALVEAGTITPDTLVWNETLPKWLSYAEVAGETLEQSQPTASSSQIHFRTTPTAGSTARCSECGKSFDRNDMIRYQDVWVCANCKPIFVQKLKEGAKLPGEMIYAGFWIRFVAKIIDGLIQWIIGIVINEIIELFMPAIGPESSGSTVLVFILVVYFINIGLAAAYTTFFLGKYAATPGKMACGLKVITSDGGSVSYARAFGRYFAEWLSGLILAIGYIMAAFDEEKRALHDRICDTRVIKK
jgi:uncharacterized RDD family membrane protein YckC